MSVATKFDLIVLSFRLNKFVPSKLLPWPFPLFSIIFLLKQKILQFFHFLFKISHKLIRSGAHWKYSISNAYPFGKHQRTIRTRQGFYCVPFNGTQDRITVSPPLDWMTDFHISQCQPERQCLHGCTTRPARPRFFHNNYGKLFQYSMPIPMFRYCAS